MSSPDIDHDWTGGAVCSKVVSLFPRVHREVDQLLIVEDRLVGDVSQDGSSHKSLHDLSVVPGDVHQDTELPDDLPRAEEDLEAPQRPLVLEEIVVGDRPGQYWKLILTELIRDLQSDVIPGSDPDRQLQQREILKLTQTFPMMVIVVVIMVVIVVVTVTILTFAEIFVTLGNDLNGVMVNLNARHEGCLR